MRSAMILALTMMSAACSQGAAPPESSAASSGNSSPSDNNRIVTTTTEHVDATQLRQSFLSGRLAQVVHDMNVMLTSSDAEALAYLQAVWAFDPKVTGELDAAFIRSTPVRAYMANVLAQSVGNRMIKIDLAPVREALRNGLSVPDRDVKSDSLIGLGFVAEPSDIDQLVQLAEGSNAEMSTLAIAALANVCGQYAVDRLDWLIKNAKDPKVRADAESMRNDLKDATSARCAGK